MRTYTFQHDFGLNIPADSELPESSRQLDFPPITLHRLSQGEGFPSTSEDKTFDTTGRQNWPTVSQVIIRIDSCGAHGVCLLQSYRVLPPSVDICQRPFPCFLSKAQRSIRQLSTILVKASCFSSSDSLTPHKPDNLVQVAYRSQQRPSTPEEKYLQQLLAKESKQVPPAKLGVLLLLFAGALSTSSPL